MLNQQQILIIPKDKRNAFDIGNFVLFGLFTIRNNHNNSDIDIVYI